MFSSNLRSRPFRPTCVVLALALLIIIGAAIRLSDAGHSLWLDELHTAWSVSGGFDEIAPRARIGNYSPFYFWIVWASAAIGGLSEWSVRLPSLMAGIVLIPAVYWFTFRLTRNVPASLLAALLATLDANVFTWYSQEARPYALIQLLGLLHVWIFYELVGRPLWKFRVLFVAATVALFYLHYTTPLILAGELAWYGWRRYRTAIAVRRGNDKSDRALYRWPQLALDLAAVVLCCLPAAGHLIEIFQRREGWTLFVKSQPPQAIFTLFPLMIIVVGGCAASLFAAWICGRKQENATPSPQDRMRLKHAGMLIFCWLFVPLATAWAMTFMGLAHVFYHRYLMFCACAFPIAVGWAAAILPSWRLRAALAFAAILGFQILPAAPGWPHGSLALFISNGGFAGHFSEDWRGAVGYVRTHDPDGRDPVFLWPGLIEGRQFTKPIDSKQDPDGRLRDYLLFPITGIYSLNDGRELHPLAGEGAGRLRMLDMAIERLKTEKGGWFLIRTHASAASCAERFSNELKRRFGIQTKTMRKKGFCGVVAFRLAVENGSVSRQEK